jgi:hypothetical protein
MSNDRIREEVKFLTEVFRLIWVTLLGVGGGVLSLVFGEQTPLKNLFAGGGLLLAVWLVTALYALQRRISALIAQIKEGEG